MKKYYLAYGSNLNLERMSKLCPNSHPIFKTFLNNYRLVYKGPKKNRSYLTIEKCEGAKVPVVIYEIDNISELKLDSYENYPTLYYKDYFKIEINNKEINALIYIMNDIYDYNLPSFEYLEILKEGYENFKLDTIYLVNALKVTIDNIPKKLIK